MRVLGTTSKGVITKFDGLTRKICVGRSDETMNWNWNDHKQSYDILYTLWNGLMRKIYVRAKNRNCDDHKHKVMIYYIRYEMVWRGK